MQTSPVSKFYSSVADLHLPQQHPAAYTVPLAPDYASQTFHEQTCLWPLGGRCEKMRSRGGPDEY